MGGPVAGAAEGGVGTYRQAGLATQKLQEVREASPSHFGPQRACPVSQHPGLGLAASRAVRVHLCYLKPPSLWPFSWQPWKPVPGRLRDQKPRSSVLT